MKSIFLSNWNLMRIIRLVIAGAVITQGVYTHNRMLVVLGSLFASMAIFNVGCCGANGCGTKPSNISTKEKEIEYEEVVV